MLTCNVCGHAISNYFLHTDCTCDLVVCCLSPSGYYPGTVGKHMLMTLMLTLIWCGGYYISSLCHLVWLVSLYFYSLYLKPMVKSIHGIRSTLWWYFTNTNWPILRSDALVTFLASVGLVTLFIVSNLAWSFHSFFSFCTASWSGWSGWSICLSQLVVPGLAEVWLLQGLVCGLLIFLHRLWLWYGLL